MLSSPCFQYNIQDLNMMLLNSRMFLIELSTFMTSLAALAFHLALLLNCYRFGLGFFSPSLDLGLLMLMSQISSLSVGDSDSLSHCGPCCTGRDFRRQCLLAAPCAYPNLFSGHSETVQMVTM